MGLATSLWLCDEHTVQPGPGRADWAGNLVTAPCFACVLLVTDLKTRRRRDNPRGQGKLLQPCRRHHLVHPACGTEAGGWGGSVPGRRSGLTQCRRANARDQREASREAVGTPLLRHPARRTRRLRSSALQGQGLRRGSAGGSGSGSQGGGSPMLAAGWGSVSTWSRASPRGRSATATLGVLAACWHRGNPVTLMKAVAPAREFQPSRRNRSVLQHPSTTPASQPLPQPRGRNVALCPTGSQQKRKKSTWNRRCHRSQLWKMQPAP